MGLGHCPGWHAPLPGQDFSTAYLDQHTLNPAQGSPRAVAIDIIRILFDICE